MDNPLYNGGGKGSNPRNCFSSKFKKNYDGIKWGDSITQKFVKDYAVKKPWLKVTEKRK